ncbi:MAG: alpha/beta fold hydrolase [Chloroflexi bacterium AL-W]|nr:alpha/beta fold hydrolase [Chloroflexi bacterium AL-N1]NOK65269.1 alpha/beta fold hydrolase [Chloroflexi bacterium AL-N10]NOK72466.1 alpha/beta fold hydrolase [Chloroflexi bacterium AL-N5]NOK79448.1 alpha/beta fold hydrolase [Chloroflexi bacterium AL-W]NOK87364.1 alpha/beta fold hydrolase [Chloroflexi bacterium AL-N15]
MAGYDFARYLKIRSAYDAHFAPDNTKVAFLTNITGVPQVWQVSTNGGWPEQCTFFDDRVSFVEYSPVHECAIFGMDIGGSEQTQLYLMTTNGEHTISLTAAAPTSIHTFGGWSPDGTSIAFSANRRDLAHFDVYVQTVGPCGEGDVQCVYEGSGTNRVVGWGPDGTWLIISYHHANQHNDLYRLDLNSRELQLLTPDNSGAQFVDINITPDGRGLYLATDLHNDFVRPAYLDLATLELQRLDDVPWDIDIVRLSPNGQFLVVITNEAGYSRWHIRDLVHEQDIAAPTNPPGMCMFADFAHDSAALAFTLTGPQNPADIWIYDLQSEQTRQITHSSSAGIPHTRFVVPEPVHFPTFDQRQIPGGLYLPQTTSDTKPPVVIDVHGGPESQRRVEFNPIYQYFLHCGYAIFAPNVRGSTGYGRAFSQLDDVEKRMDSVKDLAHAAYWLKDSGIVDPQRVAVMGGSYGGFMVLAALTNYPDLWTVGVDVVGIANFVTFLANTSPWRRHLREVEYGSLARDRELLERISPIHKVDQIRVPLMVIHGANDPRVPIGEAEQIVESIKQRNGIVEYLRFDDEGHGIIKLTNRLICYPAIERFLNNHLH